MFTKLNSYFTRICVCVALVGPSTAWAQSAGTVIFKSGDAVITHADNSTAPMAKNDPINAGDTIDTRSGRVQLSFTDGGKVSLQPQTVYKINQYAFSGKEDGSEYAITELIKGGLRTITGLIGHKHRERYQLHTPVATIGIRGTEFSVVYNNTKLLMTTNHGSVDVCNTGGCLNAVTGQTITAFDKNTQPQYTNEIAKVTSAPPSAHKPVFVQAENLNEARVSEVVASSVDTSASMTNNLFMDEAVIAADEVTATMTAGSTTSATTTVTTVDNSGPTPVVTTTAVTEVLTMGDAANIVDTSDFLVAAVSKDNTRTYYNYALQDGNYEANSNGNLINYEASGIDLKIVRASTDDLYSDAYVIMGRAKGKVEDNNVGTLSYIKGNFTDHAGMIQLASLSTPFTYNVIASTAPVITSNAGKVVNIGSSNTVTGNMSVNFANLAYSYNLVVPLTSVNGLINLNLAGASALTANSPLFTDNGSVSTSLGNIGCYSGCSGILVDSNGNAATVSGAFFGSEAERAGIQYGVTTGSSNITGSVLLAK